MSSGGAGPGQVWWQAADGRWYPPTSRPGYEWSGRPVHVRTGCGGLTGTFMFALIVSVLLLGSGHLGLLLLLVPVVLVFAAVSFLRMIGRTVVMLSKISDEAWQEANRHAQERLAEQLRFFAQQHQAGGFGPGAGGPGSVGGFGGFGGFGAGTGGFGRAAGGGAFGRAAGGGAFGRDASGGAFGRAAGGGAGGFGRPNPPGPARDTAEWARTVLGVRPGATPVEIRRAYREASKRWHPDLFMQASPAEREDAARHMEDVNAAHAILSGGDRGRVA